MDQGPAPEPASWTLRSRGPAHAVSHRCLELQRRARPRGRLARLLGVDPLHPDAVGAYRRALGERQIGGLLAQLGAGWRVLHAVPHGEADQIDHLVIGPPGVFAVTSTPAAAHHDARSASRLLSRATGSRIVAEPLVASPTHALRAISALPARPARLDADVVARLARAAEEWTTWRPFGVDLPTHTDPDAAFARLHAEVERARRRRLFWGLTSLVLVSSALVGAASSLLF
jgi:hypothetical protein